MKSVLFGVFLMLPFAACDFGEPPEPGTQSGTPDFRNVENPKTFLLELQAQGAIPAADVNADGFVDIADLVIVAQNFGQEVDVPQPMPGLPLSTAGYDGWLRMNAKPIASYNGDPHNGTKNVFVNQTRATLAPAGQRRFPYPDGTILVKESTRPGADFIGLVAIMRKVEGSDPAHNDWKFIEYTRNRADASFTVAAKDAVCWNCHAGAAQTDYAFTVLE